MHISAHQGCLFHLMGICLPHSKLQKIFRVWRMDHHLVKVCILKIPISRYVKMTMRAKTPIVSPWGASWKTWSDAKRPNTKAIKVGFGHIIQRDKKSIWLFRNQLWMRHLSSSAVKCSLRITYSGLWQFLFSFNRIRSIENRASTLTGNPSNWLNTINDAKFLEWNKEWSLQFLDSNNLLNCYSAVDYFYFSTSNKISSK